ncbi:MAG: C40 family peptidase [Candidatus Protochlamydia sp.]|nr:C40 family peptidase [Candidatus Protochlamydia sp.]
MQKKISIPVLNVFAEPNETSEVVSQVLYGWTMQVLKENENFCFIQSPDGYQGWVSALHLTEVIDYPSLPIAKIKHNAAHIYANPHVNRHKPLLTLPYEVELPILSEPPEEDFRWIEVQLLSGQKGWVQRGNVTVNPTLLSLHEALELSHQFIGLPYTWGGRSSFGYDCSGFVQMLLKQMGIQLPRDARQQIQCPSCQKIDWDKKEAGDLLFFGSALAAITHVAVYLGGENLIHAAVKPIPLLQVSEVEELTTGSRFAYYAACRVVIDF